MPFYPPSFSFVLYIAGSNKELFGRLSPSEQQQFFVARTSFFAKRYGENNVLSALSSARTKPRRIYI